MGLNCLEYMHTFVSCITSSVHCNTREAAFHMMTSKCAIVRLFLRNGCDIHETYQKPILETPFSFFSGYHSLRELAEGPGGSEEPIWRDKWHYLNIWLQFLHDQNIDVDYVKVANISKRGTTLLQRLIYSQTRGLDTVGRRNTEAIFMLCTMGANVSARMPDSGEQPLHLVGTIPYSPEKALHVGAQFEILLQFGADPCARDGHGRTVTEVAVFSGWEEQWFGALTICNKHQVIQKQWKEQLAGREDAPPDDAIRTGADTSDLRKSSIEGLSRRTVARGNRLDD